MASVLLYCPESELDLGRSVQSKLAAAGHSIITNWDIVDAGALALTLESAIRSFDAIVMIWPRHNREMDIFFEGLKVVAERENKLIAIAHRGTAFDTLLAFYIAYVGEEGLRDDFLFSIRTLEVRGRVPERDLAMLKVPSLRPPKLSGLWNWGGTRSRPRRTLIAGSDLLELDVSLLDRHAERSLRSRAIELEHFAEVSSGFADYQSPSSRRQPGYRQYVLRYGSLTPWLLLAVPTKTTERDVLDHLSRSAPANLASGRFFLFGVSGEGGEPSLGQFAHNLLRRHVFLRRVNSSPVQGELFGELVNHATRQITRQLDLWLEEADRRPEVSPQHEFDALQERAALLGSRAAFYFVSYSRENTAWAAQFVATLKERGIDTWFDQVSIVGGEAFVRSIAKGIGFSRAVIPMCSIPFSRSEWCLREVLFADQKRKSFFPVWLSNPALEDEMQLVLSPYHAVMATETSAVAAAHEMRDVISRQTHR